MGVIHLLLNIVPENGQFNLSGVLFIPPANTAGTLMRSYRLRHRRGIVRR